MNKKMSIVYALIFELLSTGVVRGSDLINPEDIPLITTVTLTDGRFFDIEKIRHDIQHAPEVIQQDPILQNKIAELIVDGCVDLFVHMSEQRAYGLLYSLYETLIPNLADRALKNPHMLMLLKPRTSASQKNGFGDAHFEAAQQGDQSDPNVLIALAHMLNNGWRKEDETWHFADKRTAIDLYKKAAGLGSVHAQSMLAFLYEKGCKDTNQRSALQPDLGKAVACYKKAAPQGNIIAMNNLGHLLHFGWTTLDNTHSPPDHAKAAAWYQAASRRGNGASKLNLGFLYESGWAMADGSRQNPDLDQAADLYFQAQEQLVKGADKKLRNLLNIKEINAPLENHDWHPHTFTGDSPQIAEIKTKDSAFEAVVSDSWFHRLYSEVHIIKTLSHPDNNYIDSCPCPFTYAAALKVDNLLHTFNKLIGDINSISLFLQGISTKHNDSESKQPFVSTWNIKGHNYVSLGFLNAQMTSDILSILKTMETLDMLDMLILIVKTQLQQTDQNDDVIHNRKKKQLDILLQGKTHLMKEVDQVYHWIQATAASKTQDWIGHYLGAY